MYPSLWWEELWIERVKASISVLWHLKVYPVSKSTCLKITQCGFVEISITKYQTQRATQHSFHIYHDAGFSKYNQCWFPGFKTIIKWPPDIWLYIIYSVLYSCPSSYAPRIIQLFMLWCVLFWLDEDQFYPHPSGLLHWWWGNHIIAPVAVKQPRRIWVNA